MFAICQQNNNNREHLAKLAFTLLLSNLDRLKSIAMTLTTTENVEPIISQEWQPPLENNSALTQTAIDHLRAVGLFRAVTVSTNNSTSINCDSIQENGII